MSFELVAHVLIGFAAFGLVCVVGGGAAYVGIWAARSPHRTHRTHRQ